MGKRKKIESENAEWVRTHSPTAAPLSTWFSSISSLCRRRCCSRHTMRPFRPWAFSVFVIRHSPPLRISTRVCVERIKKKRRKEKQNPKALRSSTGRKEVPGSVITGRLVRRPAFSARAASREDWSRPERVRFLHGTFNRRLLSW